jgi:hypothetical protein
VIAPGKSASFTVIAKMQSGSFNNPISLSCSGIPSTLNCTFSPGAITPGSGSASSTVTVSAASVSKIDYPGSGKFILAYASWLLPLGIVIPFLGKTRYKRTTHLLSMAFLVGIGIATLGCGGKSSATQAAAVAGNYAVTINGNSSSSQISTIVNITIQ